jgi:hypothetical protein
MQKFVLACTKTLKEKTEGYGKTAVHVYMCILKQEKRKRVSKEEGNKKKSWKNL